VSKHSSLGRRVLASVGMLATATIVGVFVLGPGRGQAATRTSTAHGTLRLAASQTTASNANIAAGKRLFVESCSTCHGVNAEGSGRAPNLVGLGGAIVDLWLSSGWMPLAEPTAAPQRKPPLWGERQRHQVVDYVTSLGPNYGPGIPYNVDTSHANVSTGFSLFALNCAPCHTITGAGDALTDGVYAPALHGLTNTQVWEAVRTGPANMPPFSPGTISPAQLTDVIAYVTGHIQYPAHPGGLALGGVGPVAEGFVGLFFGVGGCLLLAFWVGDRSEKDDEDDERAEGMNA
jgi:ubiquinol-cytochrome c reductase cytochrome c subunit